MKNAVQYNESADLKEEMAILIQTVKKLIGEKDMNMEKEGL